MQRRLKRLFELASEQGGYFTTKQAKSLGYSGSKQHYHVHAGNWLREHRGVFRLAFFPQPERPDLLLWWLWSRDRSDTPTGVYSHRTALSLYDLTDLMPSKLDMTVPRNFRRNSEIPRILRLHRADVPRGDVDTRYGVPVTKPLRSVLDLNESGDVHRGILREAVQEALRRGLIRRTEIRKLRGKPDWLQGVAENEHCPNR